MAMVEVEIDLYYFLDASAIVKYYVDEPVS